MRCAHSGSIRSKCWYGNGGPYQTGGDTAADPIRASGVIPAEFQVNTYTTGYQGRPSSCGLPDGEFVVSWVSFGQNPNGSSIHSRLVDVDSGPSGNEFEISSDATGNFEPGTYIIEGGKFTVNSDATAQGTGVSNGEAR